MRAESKPFEAEVNAALDLWHSGDAEGAITALQALASEYPDEAAIRGMLGGYLYEQGGLREALPHTQRAVELCPRSELAARQHFHVLHDLGRLSEALEELQRFHGTISDAALKREWRHLIGQIESQIVESQHASARRPTTRCS
jgi:tetratricopeptide (TPR) repeat protein